MTHSEFLPTTTSKAGTTVMVEGVDMEANTVEMFKVAADTEMTMAADTPVVMKVADTGILDTRYFNIK